MDKETGRVKVTHPISMIGIRDGLLLLEFEGNRECEP